MMVQLHIPFYIFFALPNSLQTILFQIQYQHQRLIHKFLNTLNVYAHGRSDGEQCSSSIIEGLSHHLPMISHTATSMGQKEQIGDAGEVVEDYLEYSDVMKNLMNNKNYYVLCKLNAEKRYREIYNVPSIISKFVELYQGAAGTR